MTTRQGPAVICRPHAHRDNNSALKFGCPFTPACRHSTLDRMAISLRWRVLIPLAVALLWGMGLLAVEHVHRVRQAQRVTLIQTLNDDMTNAALRALENHDRAMQRAQDALLETDPDKRIALLKWNAEHYLDDSEQRLNALAEPVHHYSATDLLRTHGIAFIGLYTWNGTRRFDPLAATWQTDLERLLAPVQNVRVQAQKVGSALDGLLGAIQSSQTHTGTGNPADTTENSDAAHMGETLGDIDPEVYANAQRDLYRADRTFQNAMRVVENTLQRTLSRQIQLATQPGLPVPPGLWWGFFVWVAIALVLAHQPLWRLHRMLSPTPHRRQELDPQAQRTSVFASPEERAVMASVQKTLSEQDDLEARLDERSRDVERAVATARRTEHELALLKLYNEHLVNSLRSAIVVTDGTGHITAANRAARSLLHITPEHVGAPIQQHPLFAALNTRMRDPWTHIEKAKEAILPLRFDGLPFGPVNTPSSTPHINQQALLFDIAIVPYQDESGRARGLLWVIDDMTDAVRTKNQLLGAERLAAIGRLSSQVAHEIRNPLSAIALNAELLEDEFTSDLGEPHRTEAIQLLRAIAQEIERLTDITEGYLQLARLPRPQFRQADLNQVVADLFSMLAEEMKSHGVHVHMQLATPAPTAWADPGQLRQALLNIVRNSREAMTHGGELTVRTYSQDHDHACIQIQDTGPGIPASLRPRVFEPFFSTKPDGTGLGLSLTQQMIAEHGGSIHIDGATGADAEGNKDGGRDHDPSQMPGTCITICLPQAAGAAATA